MNSAASVAYICVTLASHPYREAAAMERKTETLNLRVTPELKDLLRLASTRERRTLSNMVEYLVREHCERNQIASPPSRPALRPKAAR